MPPQNWNILEIPEPLNGGGVTIVITAEHGGFLVFIPDDGILLNQGFAETLTDPTQPLPSMAVELQKKLIPDSPDYFGKRIGKAKVFSSMARRAGVSDACLIVPIQITVADISHQIWFIGDVPHPERAFAKRNPALEQRIKKTKLFSEEILSDLQAPTEILPLLNPSESENSDLTSAQTVQIEPAHDKSSRRLANLSGLLALKQQHLDSFCQLNNLNGGGLETNLIPDYNNSHNSNSTQTDCSNPAQDDVRELEAALQSQPELPVSQTITPLYQVPPLISDGYLTADVPALSESVQTVSAALSLVETIAQAEREEQSPTVEIQAESAEPVETQAESTKPVGIQAESAEPVEVQAESTKPEEIQAESTEPEEIQAESTEPDLSAVINHPLLNIKVKLAAVITHRQFILNDIIKWKPGEVIPFDFPADCVAINVKNQTVACGKAVLFNGKPAVQIE